MYVYVWVCEFVYVCNEYVYVLDFSIYIQKQTPFIVGIS